MGKTSIQWTQSDDGSPGKTWNPVRGCSRVSQGCVNCYAESIARRFSAPGQPFHLFAAADQNGQAWTGKVAIVEEHLKDPLHWKQPQRIFVNSMSDLFHENLPFEEIDKVFTVMAAAPQHTYQILTKRPARMLAYFGSGCHDNGIGPNRADYHLEQQIWLGVSVEDQKTADDRSAILRQVPATVRFISQEPQLSGIDWPTGSLDGISWLIQGGESGPGAREFNIHWAIRTRQQCAMAGTKYFLKQLGSNVVSDDCGLLADTWFPGKPRRDGYRVILSDRKGGDIQEWPTGLRVREFPA